MEEKRKERTCLIPDLREKAFSLSPLILLLVVAFSLSVLYQVEEVSLPSLSGFFRLFCFVLSRSGVRFCRMLFVY